MVKRSGCQKSEDGGLIQKMSRKLSKTGVKMQPLSAPVRSACFFYGIFFVLMVLCSMITGVHVQTAAAGESVWTPEQMMQVSEDFRKSWQQTLNDQGYDPVIVERRETVRLNEKVLDSQTMTWVGFSEQIILIEAVDEKALVRLGFCLKQTVHNWGLEVQDIKWGYRERRLWLRLTVGGSYQFAGRTGTVRIGEITMIQPLSKSVSKAFNWEGLIPETPPKLPETKPEEPKTPDPDGKSELAAEVKDILSVASKVLPLPPISSQVPVPDLPTVKRKARVSIIIDDVGYVKGPADKMLEVPAPLTWAFLPMSPYGNFYEEAARKRGFEIMLHLPLEPFDSSENPGPGLIKREWTEEEILRQLDLNLKSVPSARGVNNHMGSAGTSDPRLMDIIMAELKRRNLYFIDSYTSNRSVAKEAARKHQVPFAQRHIFIDHDSSYEAKIKALQEVIRIALRDGEAIAIGHVREGTAEAIMEMLPEFTKAGIEIVPVSELVR